MKIAFLHFWTLRLRRGVETLILSLANELAHQGMNITLLTATQTQSPLVASVPTVRVRAYPTFHYYEAATIVPFYAFNLARERYDVVVVFFADFGEGPALWLADRLQRSRLCLYLTFPYEAAPHRYHAYRQWGWEARADVVLADAVYTARCGEQFLGRPVSVLPSGTDPARFRPDPVSRAALRCQLGLSETDVVLLNVSALEKRKGTWRVIEALPSLLTRFPDLCYLILGDGSDRASLEARAKELGVLKRVIFGGTTTNLPEYYNAADIFVMLSDAEAGSVACLEAMASGLPVVVSTTGGFAEVVPPSGGLLVDQNDPAAIEAALASLARSSNLRQKLGEGARQVVLEKYSWPVLARQLLKVLE